MAIIKSGSVALITGGASGIGFQLVKLLVEQHIRVVIADLKTSDECQRYIHDSNGNAIFVQCDVTSWTDLQCAFDKTIEAFGTVDLLVPNAGVFEMSSSSFWHPPGTAQSKDTVESSTYKTLEINITHPIRLSQMGIEYFMKEKKEGHILLVSSIAAQTPTLTKPMYCASKAAISSFTKSLGPLAAPPEGREIPRIVVNAIAPGMVWTPLWYTDQEDMKGWAAGGGKHPPKDGPFDWLMPEEIAEEILKMVMTDDERYKGGNVVERTLGKTRVVGTPNDDIGADGKPDPKDAPPMLKMVKMMAKQNPAQLVKMDEAQNAPAFEAMETMMKK